MPMRTEKDGAGTGQARGATETCSDEKADLGGCKGRGSQETETALLGEGCSELQHVCVCVGEVHVYMGTSGQVPTKCQLLLWQLDSNCFVLSIVAQICYPIPGTCPRPSKLVSASAQLPAGSS